MPINREDLKFGDNISNGFASKDNPLKVTCFVGFKQKSYKNRYGIRHTTEYVHTVCDKGKNHNWGMDMLKHEETFIVASTEGEKDA